MTPLEPTPEGEHQLVGLVKSGDREALGLLYERYQGILFRLLVVRAGQRELAQECVQETFLKVWLNRKRLNPNLAFFPLVAKIGKNLVHDFFKHQGVKAKYQEHLVSLTDTPTPNPEQDLGHKMLRDKITEIVNLKLSHRCRTVFQLSRIEGLKNQEIADLLGISRKTVENQLTHALKIIRKHCQPLLTS